MLDLKGQHHGELVANAVGERSDEDHGLRSDINELPKEQRGLDVQPGHGPLAFLALRLHGASRLRVRVHFFFFITMIYIYNIYI